MTRWFWSDLHLGHEKMYKLPFPAADNSSKPMRPFSCADEADEYMVDQYNKLVEHGDKVYFLGDVVINKKKLPFLERMTKGHKYLIAGNHDVQAPIEEYSKYFNKIYGVLYMKDIRSILTHVPVHPSYVADCDFNRFSYNIHGHSHDYEMKLMSGPNTRLSSYDSRYINVCVEKTGFRPLHEEELKARML